MHKTDNMAFHILSKLVDSLAMLLLILLLTVPGALIMYFIDPVFFEKSIDGLHVFFKVSIKFGFCVAITGGIIAVFWIIKDTIL
jgi:hypothetical protein